MVVTQFLVYTEIFVRFQTNYIRENFEDPSVTRIVKTIFSPFFFFKTALLRQHSYTITFKMFVTQLYSSLKIFVTPSPHKEASHLLAVIFRTPQPQLQVITESPLDCKEIQPVHPKGVSPECSLEGLMLKLKLQFFGHCEKLTHLKDPDAGKD